MKKSASRRYYFRGKIFASNFQTPCPLNIPTIYGARFLLWYISCPFLETNVNPRVFVSVFKFGESSYVLKDSIHWENSSKQFRFNGFNVLSKLFVLGFAFAFRCRLLKLDILLTLVFVGVAYHPCQYISKGRVKFAKYSTKFSHEHEEFLAL